MALQESQISLQESIHARQEKMDSILANVNSAINKVSSLEATNAKILVNTSGSKEAKLISGEEVAAKNTPVSQGTEESTLKEAADLQQSRSDKWKAKHEAMLKLAASPLSLNDNTKSGKNEPSNAEEEMKIKQHITVM